jgi:hypothetical protein
VSVYLGTCLAIKDTDIPATRTSDVESTLGLLSRRVCKLHIVTDLWNLCNFHLSVERPSSVFWFHNEIWCRSQWPRGLRHEMSSPAQPLGSWVRIILEAWMSVCVYSVLLLSRVGSGLATGWSPAKEVLPTVYKVQISKLIPKGHWQKGRRRRRRTKTEKKMEARLW